MNDAFAAAVTSRLNLADVGAQLNLPPIGIKDGLVPLVLISGLESRRDEIALYEHGSLVLSLDDAVAERLTKNPVHFSVKNTQTRSRSRSLVIESLSANLGIRGRRGSAPTFLNVATALYRELRILPPYVQKTKHGLSSQALAVRDAFHQATEPDVLIFETLPEIFGLDAFVGRSAVKQESADAFANQLADVVRELRSCYSVLMASVRDQLADATVAGGDLAQLRQALQADATRLDGHILEPRLKAFVAALLRPMDDQAWLENVAMVVSEGQAPRVWTDDVHGRFHLRVAQLGGALRRTSALLHGRLAENGGSGYSATWLTMTRPDGAESSEMIWLTENERVEVDRSIEEVLDSLAQSGTQRAAACRMLMARLVEELRPAVAGSDGLDTRTGEERQHG
jgi:hypothetical protein